MSETARNLQLSKGRATLVRDVSRHGTKTFHVTCGQLFNQWVLRQTVSKNVSDLLHRFFYNGSLSSDSRRHLWIKVALRYLINPYPLLCFKQYKYVLGIFFTLTPFAQLSCWEVSLFLLAFKARCQTYNLHFPLLNGADIVGRNTNLNERLRVQYIVYDVCAFCLLYTSLETTDPQCFSLPLLHKQNEPFPRIRLFAIVSMHDQFRLSLLKGRKPNIFKLLLDDWLRNKEKSNKYWK